MWTYLMDPTRVLLKARARHGSSFHLTTPIGRELFVSEPDAVARVLSDGDTFLAGRANDAIRAMVGDASTASLDGPEHLVRRRIAAPFFTTERARECSVQTIDPWTRALDDARGAASVSMHQMARDVFVEVLADVVLGAVHPKARAQFLRRLRRFGDAAALPFSQLATMPMVASGANALGRIARITGTQGLIAALDPRSALRDALPTSSERGGLLGAALKAGLSTHAVLDDAVTYVGAGYDTTATAFAWAVQELLARPSSFTELAARAREIEPADAFDWPALDAHVAESLRLHPPLPHVSRIANHELRIHGRLVRGGERVTASLFLLHREPSVFERASQYDSERPRPARGFAPFGGGPHRCPGKRLAVSLVKAGLYALLRGFMVSGVKAPCAVWRGTTLAPSDGLSVRVLRA